VPRAALPLLQPVPRPPRPPRRRLNPSKATRLPKATTFRFDKGFDRRLTQSETRNAPNAFHAPRPNDFTIQRFNVP